MNNRLKVGLLSGLLLIVAAASTRAQTTPDPLPPCPKTPQMTYDEDAQFLRSDCRNGFLDPIQYVPLGENENSYISFGYWIRERGDYASNPNWSDHCGPQKLRTARFWPRATRYGQGWW